MYGQSLPIDLANSTVDGWVLFQTNVWIARRDGEVQPPH